MVCAMLASKTGQKDKFDSGNYCACVSREVENVYKYCWWNEQIGQELRVGA